MESENDYNLNKEDKHDWATEEFQTLSNLPFILHILSLIWGLY